MKLKYYEINIKSDRKSIYNMFSDIAKSLNENNNIFKSINEFDGNY